MDCVFSLKKSTFSCEYVGWWEQSHTTQFDVCIPHNLSSFTFPVSYILLPRCRGLYCPMGCGDAFCSPHCQATALAGAHGALCVGPHTEGRAIAAGSVPSPQRSTKKNASPSSVVSPVSGTGSGATSWGVQANSQGGPTTWRVFVIFYTKILRTRPQTPLPPLSKREVGNPYYTSSLPRHGRGGFSYTPPLLLRFCPTHGPHGGDGVGRTTRCSSSGSRGTAAEPTTTGPHWGPPNKPPSPPSCQRHTGI